MMAHCCGVLVVPAPQAMKASYCRCSQCAVWWIDPRVGTLGVHAPSDRHASIIGINNSFLTEPFKPMGADEYGLITKQQIQNIIRECPDTYMFKTVESNIIRFRPGFHGISGIMFTKDRKDLPPEYDKNQDVVF